MEIYNEKGEKIGESYPEYDPITESIYCDGKKIYSEDGTGEIDVRNVVRGEVHFLGPDGNEDSTQPLFTFDDFLTECLGLRIFP